MKRFLRYTVLALILILVMMVSAVTAMRFAIHGRELLVPKFIGLKQADAQRVAEDNGLVLVDEDNFYSSTVPKGSVLSQAPGPNVRVRRGTRIHVSMSLGPSQTEVPDLSGQSMRAAQINVQRRGLNIGNVATTPGPPTGNDGDSQVLAQSPPAGSAASSPKVDLLVSDSSQPAIFLMPDLIGKQLADVQKQIEDAGFELKVNGQSVLSKDEKKSSTPKRGVITKQNPPAGHRVVAKSTIALEVSVEAASSAAAHPAGSPR